MTEYTESKYHHIRKERIVHSCTPTGTRITIETNSLTPEQADELYNICAEQLTRIETRPKEIKGLNK